MTGAASFFRKIGISLGLRKAPPTPRVATPPADDDFVARYGLSYGAAPNLMSDEARFEEERLKTIRMTPRK
jgi:hypothetical protein